MKSAGLQDPGALGEVERIAILYAPRNLRSRYRSLLLLDSQLARIALTGREPMLAQLKLAWWRDTCGDLSKPSGHHVAQDLAIAWHGEGKSLLPLVDAWEVAAVQGGSTLAAAQHVATARADAAIAAAGLADGAGALDAARRWTLFTLATHAPDDVERVAMINAARAIDLVRLPRSLRPLAVLDGLALRALRRGAGALLGDRLSPLAALRLGIFGR